MKKATIRFFGKDEYGCRATEEIECYAETTAEVLQFINEFYTEEDEICFFKRIAKVINYRVINIQLFDDSLWNFEYWTLNK